MIQESPIFVTGCQRSGTSIIAAMIHHCGAFLGNTSKRGMYENDKIRETIVKPYLSKIGADPKGQNPLPEIVKVTTPMNWRAKIEAIMWEEGYRTGPWMYKANTLGLIWPVWHNTFPDAKWVIVRRKPNDIINSCMKTGYMTGYATPEGWKRWVLNNEQRFVEMITEGVNVKQVWPERIVQGNYTQLHELIEWLGLEWKDEALNAINPLLWSNKQKERSI